MRDFNRFTAMCARCRQGLRGGQSTGESGLYSPGRAFTLCEPCFFAEEEETEDRGTNNLPDRLEQYRENLRLGPLVR